LELLIDMLACTRPDENDTPILQLR